MLGVQDRLTMSSFSAGLHAMAAAARGQPLPDAQMLGVALQLADFVVEARQLYGGGSYSAFC